MNERLDNIALIVFTSMLGAGVAFALVLVLCGVKP